MTRMTPPAVPAVEAGVVLVAEGVLTRVAEVAEGVVVVPEGAVEGVVAVVA